jgi:GntR family transcriptional regulator
MSSIKIDVKSTTPIFQQIINEIERLILLGEMKTGDFIPSVREFAVTHSINPNTVAKAYSLLQTSGLVEFVRGTGLRVIKHDPATLQKRRQMLLAEKVLSFVEEVSALGFKKTDIIKAIQDIKTRKTI